MNDAPKDKRLSLLIPSAFLASFGIGVINFVMIFIVKERFSASADTVGWFTAIWALSYFCGCILLKRPADKMGPRASMATMSLGSALLLGLFLVFPSLTSAFITYATYGFICAFFWPPLMAWLSTGLEGSRLGKATSLFNLSWSAGGVFAPYVGGLLAERDLALPVYAGILVFAFTGALIIATRSSVPSPARAKASAQDRSIVDSSTPLRYPAWIGVFLIYAVLAVFFNIFPVFAKDELGLSESKIGFLLLVRAAFAALGFWAMGRFEFWHFKKRYILLGTILLLALDLAFLPLRSPLAFGLGLAALGLVQEGPLLHFLDLLWSLGSGR